MNLITRDADTLADPSAESVLSFADEPVDVLRKRVQLALRYTYSWTRAAGSAVDTSGVRFSDRISALQGELFGLLELIPAGSVFVGNAGKAMYETTSADYAQLYRDLVFSGDTLPDPALIEVLGDLASAALKAPVAAAKSAAEALADAIKNLLGNTAAAIWSNLWPWLLVAGAGGIVYVFRAPLLRAVQKVSQ